MYFITPAFSIVTSPPILAFSKISFTVGINVSIFSSVSTISTINGRSSERVNNFEV